MGNFKKIEFKFRHIKILFSLLVCVFLVFIIKDIDISAVKLNLSFEAITLIFTMLTLSLLLRAWRWQILMNDAANAVKISFSYSMKLLFIGQALNVVMPAGAGDIAKSYFGYKHTGLKERMFSVSLFDKLIAIASIGILALYSAIVSKEALYVLLVIASFLPLAVLLTIKYFMKISAFYKLFNYINKKVKRIDFFEVVSNLKFKRKTIIISLILSLIAWIFTYSLLYYCFVVFKLEVSFSKVIIFSPLLTLARLFPLTLNGLGSDEALMVYLFSTNNEALMSGVLFAAILYRLILIITPSLPGILFILTAKLKKT